MADINKEAGELCAAIEYVRDALTKPDIDGRSYSLLTHDLELLRAFYYLQLKNEMRSFSTEPLIRHVALLLIERFLYAHPNETSAIFGNLNSEQRGIEFLREVLYLEHRLLKGLKQKIDGLDDESISSLSAHPGYLLIERRVIGGEEQWKMVANNISLKIPYVLVATTLQKIRMLLCAREDAIQLSRCLERMARTAMPFIMESVNDADALVARKALEWIILDTKMSDSLETIIGFLQLLHTLLQSLRAPALQTMDHSSSFMGVSSDRDLELHKRCIFGILQCIGQIRKHAEDLKGNEKVMGVAEKAIERSREFLSAFGNVEDGLIALFSGNDSDLFAVMDCTMSIASSQYKPPVYEQYDKENALQLPKFISPTLLFLRFLRLIAYDEHTLVDFLLEDTGFLPLFLGYLRYFQSTYSQDHEAEVTTEDWVNMGEVFERLISAIEKSLAHDIFPYNVEPLLRRLRRVCQILFAKRISAR
ncbi:uncharacterized protein VTP21DRAFT_7394 [Calcarisporiella thermophila]|uniref:uncharacterized protein n=1 Tax=Calcarisporiella thermophila TaxID=911321 RepID=UPI0037442DB8